MQKQTHSAFPKLCVFVALMVAVSLTAGTLSAQDKRTPAFPQQLPISTSHAPESPMPQAPMSVQASRSLQQATPVPQRRRQSTSVLIPIQTPQPRMRNNPLNTRPAITIVPQTNLPQTNLPQTNLPQTNLPQTRVAMASMTYQQSTRQYDQPFKQKPDLETSSSATNEDNWFGTIMTFPDGNECNSAKIVVHPPTSGADNEFGFVIENLGSRKSEAFTIAFAIPENVTVLQVFPFGAIANPHSVIMKFDEMSAGEKSNVHIKTTASPTGSFPIQASVRMENVQSFNVQSTPANDRNGNQNLNRSQSAYRVPAQQTSASHDVVTRLPQSNLPKSYIADQPILVDEMTSGNELPSAGKPLNINSVNTISAGRVVATQPALTVPKHAQTITPIKRPVEAVRALQPSHQPRNSTGDIILLTSLSGDDYLKQGQEYKFQIAVENTSNSAVSDIIVQLALPEGLMITNLDRQAWIDQKTRTVSWKLERLAASEIELIPYQLEALEAGLQSQKISVGMNNTYQGEVIFESTTVNSAAMNDTTTYSR